MVGRQIAVQVLYDAYITATIRLTHTSKRVIWMIGDRSVMSHSVV